MSSFGKKLSPGLKSEVIGAVKAPFASAAEPTTDVVDGAVRRSAQDEQLNEMRRLAAVLEAGSSSLNQRATTLAGLAVAGLGTFGLFAGKLNEVHGADARQIVAIALAVASFSLAIGAGFALFAVFPGGRWAVVFSAEAKPLIEGDLTKRGEATAAMVKMQLARNSEKAVWMKRAYGATAVALIAVFVAVVSVAHEATKIWT